MSETIDEISIERWEEGTQLIKQLKKQVLTRGAWTTIMFLCEELDPKTGEYKAPNARLVRYRKLRGKYMPQAKFNISNGKQAIAIAKILEEWFAAGSNAEAPEDSGNDAEE